MPIMSRSHWRVSGERSGILRRMTISRHRWLSLMSRSFAFSSRAFRSALDKRKVMRSDRLSSGLFGFRRIRCKVDGFFFIF